MINAFESRQGCGKYGQATALQENTTVKVRHLDGSVQEIASFKRDAFLTPL